MPDIRREQRRYNDREARAAAKRRPAWNACTLTLEGPITWHTYQSTQDRPIGISREERIEIRAELLAEHAATGYHHEVLTIAAWSLIAAVRDLQWSRESVAEKKARRARGTAPAPGPGHHSQLEIPTS